MWWILNQSMLTRTAMRHISPFTRQRFFFWLKISTVSGKPLKTEAEAATYLWLHAESKTEQKTQNAYFTPKDVDQMLPVLYI